MRNATSIPSQPTLQDSQSQDPRGSQFSQSPLQWQLRHLRSLCLHTLLCPAHLLQHHRHIHHLSRNRIPRGACPTVPNRTESERRRRRRQEWRRSGTRREGPAACRKCNNPLVVDTHPQFYGYRFCSNTGNESLQQWRARVQALKHEKDKKTNKQSRNRKRVRSTTKRDSEIGPGGRYVTGPSGSFGLFSSLVGVFNCLALQFVAFVVRAVFG